jgi:ankyrin repeat protein
MYLYILFIFRYIHLRMSMQFGKTPLHAAARVGCVETMKLLLEKGANIFAKAENDRQVLLLYMQ